MSNKQTLQNVIDILRPMQTDISDLKSGVSALKSDMTIVKSDIVKINDRLDNLVVKNNLAE